MTDTKMPVTVYDMEVDGSLTSDVIIINDPADKKFKCYMLVAQFDSMEEAKEAAEEIYHLMQEDGAAPII